MSLRDDPTTKAPSVSDALADAGILLVVEDESDARAILAAYASGIGFKVIETANGRQALEVLSTQQVDVVISDMAMPEMTGYELLQAIRSRGMRLPFIAASGFGDHKIILECMKLDVFDYLEKPFDVPSLKAILREAMRIAVAERKLRGPSQAGAAQAAQIDELLIKRLQVLSANGPEAREAMPKLELGSLPPEQRLRQMFVQEAMSQLAHSEKAIRSLSEGAGVEWELGYLYRVMNFLGPAAQVINEPLLTALIGALGHSLGFYRVRTSKLGPRELQALRHAHKLLVVAVKASGQAQTLDAHDSNLANEITACIRQLEANSPR